MYHQRVSLSYRGRGKIQSSVLSAKRMLFKSTCINNLHSHSTRSKRYPHFIKETHLPVVLAASKWLSQCWGLTWVIPTVVLHKAVGGFLICCALTSAWREHIHWRWCVGSTTGHGAPAFSPKDSSSWTHYLPCPFFHSPSPCFSPQSVWASWGCSLTFGQVSLPLRAPSHSWEAHYAPAHLALSHHLI